MPSTYWPWRGGTHSGKGSAGAEGAARLRCSVGVGLEVGRATGKGGLASNAIGLQAFIARIMNAC